MLQDLETNNIDSKDDEEDEAAVIDMFMELAKRDEVCYQFCSILFCQFRCVYWLLTQIYGQILNYRGLTYLFVTCTGANI